MTRKAEMAERLANALRPFGQHIGKADAPVTLTIGEDTWTGTLTGRDFVNASAAMRAYHEAKALSAETGAGDFVLDRGTVEACAKVADHWSDPAAKVLSAMYGMTDAEHDIARKTAEGIAAAIRSLTAHESTPEPGGDER